MELTIGEFSRITQLSIKTLRLYHEKGLLIPYRIDEFTKYRYYNVEQVEEANRIITLRQFNFSLNEISSLLNTINSGELELIPLLEKKIEEIESKIIEFQNISNSIKHIIKYEKERQKMNDICEFEIEEKEIETILYAGYRMKGKYAEIGEAFKKLGKAVGTKISGKAFALYYDGDYKEDDADFEACFPISKEISKNGVTSKTFNGGKVISLIHKGPYSSLMNSYQKIWKYIKENNLTPELPTREVYLKGPGMIFKGNPNNYLTEIQIKIK